MDENFFNAEDDGLELPIVGSWAKQKYRIVYEYNELFSVGMKKYWDQRVYIDLYSGAGKAKIEKSNRVLYSSPLLSLKVHMPYDQYVFCEKNPKYIDALEKRVNLEFQDANVNFVCGDCNEKVDEILNLLPKPSYNNKVLAFCFVDPFALIVKYNTIKKLSERFVDFLVLLAFGMDGKRNIQLYLKDNNNRIDDFFGSNDWRKKWSEAENEGVNLVKFLADEFTDKMVSLNYKSEAINNFISIRSDEKNLPLYYLGFYSRSTREYDFWKKVKKRNEHPDLFG